jgi:hypothetical protein
VSSLVTALVRGCPGGVGGADRSTEKENKEINISIETQKLGWYVNERFSFDIYLVAFA